MTKLLSIKIFHHSRAHEVKQLTFLSTIGGNINYISLYISYKSLQSPLDCKDIQPVHPKGDQSWVFIGRTDVEAKTPILWPPDVKSWLIWKDPDAGKDWRQEKWVTEDEMVWWHHWLDGHEFEQLQELEMHRETWHAAWGCKELAWLSDWTELIRTST